MDQSFSRSIDQVCSKYQAVMRHSEKIYVFHRISYASKTVLFVHYQFSIHGLYHHLHFQTRNSVRNYSHSHSSMKGKI